jgi:hypothetical protein
VAFFLHASNVSGLQVFFVFSVLLIFILKLEKLENPDHETEISKFFRLVKFDHHMDEM